MPPVIKEDACTLCGICQDVCPGDIIHLDAGVVEMVRYEDECQHCDICRVECPENAITIQFPWHYLHSPARTWDSR